MSYTGCIPWSDPFSENIHYIYQFFYLFAAICLNYRILYVIWVSKRQFYSNQSFYNLYSIDCALGILAMSFDLAFTRNWAHRMRVMIVIIVLAPFAVIWNVAISDNWIIYENGGFAITYTRRVSWASLSRMQLSLIILTVLITMVTTTVTFYKMRTMKKRIKSSERALCLAAALISFGFLLEAVTQSVFAFFKEKEWLADVMGYIQFSTWDILNVGSPLVLLLVSHQFRAHVLSIRTRRAHRVSSINTAAAAQHQHQNHPTMTSDEFNPIVENFKFAAQTLYLVPLLLLLIWMVITIRFRHRKHYAYDLFFWLFTVDCVASILLILQDLLVTRLFLYTPQLCPKFSRIFIDNPIILNIYFPFYNYVRALKPLAQCAMIVARYLEIFMSLRIDKRSPRLPTIFASIVCILPLFVIANTIISEKEVVFWHGGFFVIYHRHFTWISLSKLHFSILIITIITNWIVSMLYIRNFDATEFAKTIPVFVGPTLCVSVGFFLQAIFHSYYAFFRDSSWFPTILLDAQFLFYDLVTILTPLFTMERSKFYDHLFEPKKLAYNYFENEPSRDIEMHNITGTEASAVLDAPTIVDNDV
ncbi:unnamed protein product [Caenorhabditis sp. 36 PRJEB53466]|nr:unnamed protein product [Caenorhabditis sp. 36 PRJEB53466]